MSLGLSGTFTTEKNSQLRCGTYKARCTGSPVDGTEYGHLIGCPNRPDEFTKSASDGKRYYRPDDDENDGGVST